MRKRRVKIRRNVRVFRKLLLLLAGCLLVFLLCVRLGTRRMEAEIRQRDDRQAWDALQQVEHAGEMLIDELLGLSEDIVSQKNLVAFSTGEKGKESLVVELLREKIVDRSRIFADFFINQRSAFRVDRSFDVGLCIQNPF